MTMEQVRAERARIDDNAQAEALVAEATAVYNLAEIRKLEREIEGQERGCADLEAAVGALDKSVDILAKEVEGDSERMAGLAMHILKAVQLAESLADAVAATSTLLADARRDHALLTRLVERMGEDLEYHLYKNEDAHCPGIPVGPDQHYAPYTVIGQAEYDAAMHEAEGEPETRESTGAFGYE